MAPFTWPYYAGSGINAFNFASYLAKEGNTCTLLTFNRNLALKRKELREGVRIIRIPYLNRNLLLKLLSLPLILFYYLVQVAGNRLIIIYGAHVIGYQFLVALGKLFGRKIVFRSLLQEVDDPETLVSKGRGPAKWLALWTMRQADIYFAINPDFADAYERCVGSNQKIFLSPQGVKADMFSTEPGIDRELRTNHGIPDTSFLILSVGFLLHRKGFEESFRVLEKFKADFRYLILGEFEFGKDHFLSKYSGQAEQLRQRGESLLGEKLILAGPVDGASRYYQSADLVLINSRTEGLPNILLEAMSAGKAVLARRIPGVEYLITHLETGILYQGGEELMQWLVKLHKDPALRNTLGRNAARYIRDCCTFDHVWAGLESKLKGTGDDG